MKNKIFKLIISVLGVLFDTLGSLLKLGMYLFFFFLHGYKYDPYFPVQCILLTPLQSVPDSYWWCGEYSTYYFRKMHDCNVADFFVTAHWLCYHHG